MAKKLIGEKEIRSRAYELYLSRGSVHGHELDDWLQAEYELLQLPVERIAQLEPPKAARQLQRTKSLVAVVRAALFLAGSMATIRHPHS